MVSLFASRLFVFSCLFRAVFLLFQQRVRSVCDRFPVLFVFSAFAPLVTGALCTSCTRLSNIYVVQKKKIIIV